MVVIGKPVRSSMFQVRSHFVYYCQISRVIALITFVYNDEKETKSVFMIKYVYEKISL